MPNPISYEFYDEDFTLSDVAPRLTKLYQDIEEKWHISNLDTSYVDTNCPKLAEKIPTLFELFESHFATREIGGESEADFFAQMQDTLNTNADTLERQLEVYDDDIAKPILGRTEKVTYDLTTNDDGEGTTDEENVDLPANDPNYDIASGRNKSTSTATNTNKQTGTVTTELSDLGVRPNYESLNGFLDENRTFIKQFYLFFEPCFSPRYRRVKLYL